MSTGSGSRALGGDIGGTKTTIAWIGSDGRVTASETYPSRSFANLDSILREFLNTRPGDPEAAVFAVAGPVAEGRSHVTNLPWTISVEAVQAAFDIPRVLLLNDIEALAWAIPRLGAQDLFTLQAGDPSKKGPIAVLAPGTGLGQALLMPLEGDVRVFASEGGHADFAPTDEIQRALLDFLAREYDHVSYERIASGSGLPNIYRFFRDERGVREEPTTERSLLAADDPTPAIIEAALEETSPLCMQTVELFVSVLGAEAGNLALKALATGGVYLGGGLPPRLLPFLKEAPFLDAFRQKGRFKSLMQSIPVHVILQPQAALLGAARFARTQQQEEIRRES